MSPKEQFRSQLEREFKATRSLIASIPDGELSWSPHARSMSLGRLAQHLAEIPHWSEVILTGTEYDVASESAPAAPKSTAEILQMFDLGVSATLGALAQVTDGSLEIPWSLKKAGKVMMTMSREETFRTWVIDHQIHHRGQLSVYLRLRDIPLPPVYGPTADVTF